MRFYSGDSGGQSTSFARAVAGPVSESVELVVSLVGGAVEAFMRI